ncbi:MAG: hypothetical protein WCD86_14385 [Ktedonobacteraceae bacterium]
MVQGQDSGREKADVPHPLTRFIEPESLELLTGTGADFIEQIGLDVIRDIVLDVLTGKNLRDSTEAITRRRLAALNLAMLSLFLRGSASSPDFVSALPRVASEMLARKGLPKSERWIAQWVSGLTDKAVQNVLRDDGTLYESYTEHYIEACNEMVDNHRKIYGELSGTLQLDTGAEAQIDWLSTCCSLPDRERRFLAFLSRGKARKRCHTALRYRVGRAFRYRLHWTRQP